MATCPTSQEIIAEMTPFLHCAYPLIIAMAWMRERAFLMGGASGENCLDDATISRVDGAPPTQISSPIQLVKTPCPCTPFASRIHPTKKFTLFMMAYVPLLDSTWSHARNTNAARIVAPYTSILVLARRTIPALGKRAKRAADTWLAFANRPRRCVPKRSRARTALRAKRHTNSMMDAYREDGLTTTHRCATARKSAPITAPREIAPATGANGRSPVLAKSPKWDTAENQPCHVGE